MKPRGGTTPRRCTARSSRTGKPCQRAPIVGGTVCATHGGRAPQVRRAAEARIAALVHPSLDTLARALEADDIHAAIRAARDLLDRAGIGAPSRVELEHELRIGPIVEELEARRVRRGPRPVPTPAPEASEVDAYVV